jgi:hypothetical protein
LWVSIGSTDRLPSERIQIDRRTLGATPQGALAVLTRRVEIGDDVVICSLTKSHLVGATKYDLLMQIASKLNFELLCTVFSFCAV